MDKAFDWAAFHAETALPPVPLAVDQAMSQCIRPDGGLYDLRAYLAWAPGETELTLDGRFSVAQLLWLARYVAQQQGFGAQEEEG